MSRMARTYVRTDGRGRERVGERRAAGEGTVAARAAAGQPCAERADRRDEIEHGHAADAARGRVWLDNGLLGLDRLRRQLASPVRRTLTIIDIDIDNIGTLAVEESTHVLIELI